MTMSNYSTPTVGATVFSSDGAELGRVKEIDGSCFKIDAPMAPDYWLAADCVNDVRNGSIVLNVNKDSLKDVKLDRKEHSGSHTHG